MRPGWMRPSAIRRSRASLPTARRTGSKHEITTVSGVSSIITSTPVAASNARMLRPSRPMMRPFLESTHQLFLGLLRAQPRDLLEARTGILLPSGQCALAVEQLLVAALQLAVPLLVGGGVLLQRRLAAVEIQATAGEVALQPLPRLDQLFLGGEGEPLTRFLEQARALGRRHRRGPAEKPAADNVESRP